MKKIINEVVIMRKYVFVIITILLLLVALLICACFVSIWNIVRSQENNQETFLLSSQSPDGKYILEAYKTEPGATVDYSIKVYLMSDEKKELIYNAYHEYQVDIIWFDNEMVSINGRLLDLSIGEKYDWRTE